MTGASKGIGAAIAKDLGAAGASVVVNYVSDKAGADKVVTDIVSAGGKAVAVRADLARAADVEKLFGVAKEAFGPIDVLVNNAGIYDFALIEDVSDVSYRKQFDTNVLGPILATQQAVKHFGNKGGSIVNISSIASQTPTPTASVYSATKGALDKFSYVLAAELGPRNIRVNTYRPARRRPRGSYPRVSREPTSPPPWSRRPRLAGLASRAISQGSLPSSRPMTPPG